MYGLKGKKSMQYMESINKYRPKRFFSSSKQWSDHSYDHAPRGTRNNSSSLNGLNIQTHAHIHTCTHTYTHTPTQTHIHAHIHTYTHTPTQTHIHAHIHTYMHTYTLCGELSWWGVVLVGFELSWWGMVLVRHCPSGELSWRGVVLVGSHPGGELS